ncbi:hypothetical protein V865_002292 [Kwoniella europaea PYCC6329]|uniref:C2H2-type domain-containing protein n=1 Tax=Kwoniella europaea PYCC6329 TaxID=1423913 RepID=A0AAX4KDU7_9TREE
MVSAKSPPSKTKTPPISNMTKAKSPKSPRSPRSPRSKPAESFTPLSSILTEEPMSTDQSSPQPTRGLALRRVLSGGSSSASTLPTTPTGSSVPLSPSSTGIRTPRANRNPLTLKSDLDQMDIDINTEEKEKEGGHQLANHLDGLQVKSPQTAIPPASGLGMAPSALGITQVLGHQSDSESPHPPQSDPIPTPANGRNTTTNSTRNHDRSYSTSTEGSTTSYHPQIPSHLGSSYGPEGFPRYSRSPENSPNIFNSSQQSINGNGYHASVNAGFGGADANGKNIDPELALRQAEALAKADEAVRALNGTSSLYQSSSTQPIFEPYILQHRPPQGPEVNFVTPQQPQPSVVRQSSTSSSTTDAASTSSEESDWCIPSIEWVSTNPQSPRFLSSGYNPAGFAQAQRDRASGNTNSGNNRMPPPPASPRVQDPTQRPGTLQHQQSLPIGASASTLSGIKQSSALPLGVPPDGQAEDDDEEITVGHERRSPSTSSQSAQSGLDLLWRAAASQSKSQSHPPKPQLPVYEVSSSFDHKGKRKAGAEAVDKWRSSGIPTGLPPPTPTSIPTTTKSTGGAGGNEPPKKRRRSEMTMEPMDNPGLKRELSEEAVEEEDEGEIGSGSEYKSPSVSSEPISDGNDSEYGGGATNKRGRPGARGGRVIAGTKRATASANKTAGGGGKILVNPANAPGGVTKGGTIKKVRKVGDSPPGGNRGGRRSSGGAAVPSGGVQCEYVNPLPPYNRCTDVFTRKYDLPRHMARHARREGELVLDGKLSEEKAVLWRTIKDKPKVTCNECGENFTRMDALKRHQAKQHHH